jgi:hypothetical protein
MHIFLAIFVIWATYRWGDWRNWQKYHPTMMYFALGNLLYNFLCANHMLWTLAPDVLSNAGLTEMVYTFIIFPASALLFLTNYPQGRKKVFFHYVQWVLIYGSGEYIFYLFGRIYYQYSWSFAWSIAFNIIMFPMLKLFSVKPLIAYILSALLTVFWMKMFHIPL